MDKRQLSRDDLIAAWRFEVREVPVPEKGAEAVMYVRSISALERKGLESMSAKYTQTKRYEEIADFNYLLLVMCISDANGQRLFRDDELEIIKKFPAVVADRLFTAAAELNGLDKRKNEEQEKNFVSGSNGASPSA